MKKRLLLVLIAMLALQTALAETADGLKAEKADFSANPSQLQLGKTLTIYGYVTSIDGEPINGLAKISFRTTDKTYYIDDVEINEGYIEYSDTIANIQSGEYDISILATEKGTNKKLLIENFAKLNVFDEVQILLEPLQKKYLPGGTVTLSGQVRTIFGEEIKEGRAQITFEGESYNSNIVNGRFSYDIELPENIKTGKHAIQISFTDEKTGNWGSAEKTFSVEAVPTELKIVTQEYSVKPEETLSLRAYIYDQAGDEIKENIKIELTSTDGRSAYLDFVQSGEQLNIKIPQYSIPGTWKLKATYSDLEAEEEATVEKVKDVKIELVNQKLQIKNIGNVDYNEQVSVSLNGNEFVIKKRVYLGPGQTTVIDLAQEAPSGQYDIQVTGAAVKAGQFNDINIAGKNKKSLNMLYSALLILVIGALTYLALFKRRHFTTAMARDVREVKHGRTQLQRLQAMKGIEQTARRRSFSDEESVSDFRDRMLRDIKTTEEKAGWRYTTSKNEDKKEEDKPKGLFNMFN
ncbi:MAG: hypothetical protein Q8N77_04605 [Nanoarchaeota archaeon]|nr:hypothetical protein [Nanoarchaeota archaeon]